MALLFATGFETNSDLVRYFDAADTRYSIVSSPRRNGNYALRGAYNGGDVIKRIPGGVSTAISGIAFYVGVFYYDHYFLGFANSADNMNVELRVNTLGRLYVSIRQGAAYYYTNIYIAAYHWYYAEMKAYCAPSGGYVIVRLNGVEILNVSGINTAYSSSNPNTEIVKILGHDQFYFDDWYICDNSGMKNNDFLGDIKVLSYTPTRDGSRIDFTPVGAASNYQAVNEALQNSDTNYVTQSGIGMYDLYGFTAPSISGSLLGIQQTVTARKDDSGTRFIKLIGSYGSNNAESSSISLLDNYRTYFNIYESRLGTNEDWSFNDLNSAEFGFKIVAS
jgi:hypothetical protein